MLEFMTWIRVYQINPSYPAGFEIRIFFHSSFKLLMQKMHRKVPLVNSAIVKFSASSYNKRRLDM